MRSSRKPGFAGQARWLAWQNRAEVAPKTTREQTMDLRLVVAIIRPSALESVEKRLQELGVRGLTVTRAKGYGAHARDRARGPGGHEVMMETYAERDKA